MRHEYAVEVCLAGDFNNWERNLFMQAEKKGVWKIELPMLPPGKYTYKFCIDEREWLEDFSNPFYEPDGYNGFKSILKIKN